MPQTPEYTEVVPGTPELLIGSVKHQHDWVPKVIPQVVKAGNRHTGDGEVGSVFHFDVHEDAHHAFGGNSGVKLAVEDYNESTHSVVGNFQGDPRYKHLKYRIRFLPGPSPDTSYLKWLVDYEPATDDTPPPNDLITNLPFTGFKGLAAHLESLQNSDLTDP